MLDHLADEGVLVGVMTWTPMIVSVACAQTMEQLCVGHHEGLFSTVALQERFAVLTEQNDCGVSPACGAVDEKPRVVVTEPIRRPEVLDDDSRVRACEHDVGTRARRCSVGREAQKLTELVEGDMVPEGMLREEVAVR